MDTRRRLALLGSLLRRRRASLARELVEFVLRSRLVTTTILQTRYLTHPVSLHALDGEAVAVGCMRLFGASGASLDVRAKCGVTDGRWWPSEHTHAFDFYVDFYVQPITEHLQQRQYDDGLDTWDFVAEIRRRVTDSPPYVNGLTRDEDFTAADEGTECLVELVDVFDRTN